MDAVSGEAYLGEDWVRDGGSQEGSKASHRCKGVQKQSSKKTKGFQRRGA